MQNKEKTKSSSSSSSSSSNDNASNVEEEAVANEVQEGQDLQVETE